MRQKWEIDIKFGVFKFKEIREFKKNIKLFFGIQP